MLYMDARCSIFWHQPNLTTCFWVLLNMVPPQIDFLKVTAFLRRRLIAVLAVKEVQALTLQNTGQRLLVESLWEANRPVIVINVPGNPVEPFIPPHLLWQL